MLEVGRARDSAGDSTRDSTSARDRDITRDSASAGELEIIEKILHPHHLLVHKVQMFLC